MFDDIFDRNWELAILVCEQYGLTTKSTTLSSVVVERFEERADRIRQLLGSIAIELPNWNRQPITSPSGWTSVN
jgi:hypothetical protein